MGSEIFLNPKTHRAAEGLQVVTDNLQNLPRQQTITMDKCELIIAQFYHNNNKKEICTITDPVPIHF